MLSDEQADKIGNQLIELFSLTVQSNGRVNCQGGDKTPKGVALTVQRIFHENRYTDLGPISDHTRKRTRKA